MYAGAMRFDQQELLDRIAELRRLCTLPAAPGVYERIDRVAKSIQQDAGVPAVAAQALDVRFRAEDIYVRPHLMPEQVLRQMLNDRLHRLEAVARASTAPTPLVPVERRSNARTGRRASDRLAHGTPGEP